MKALFIKKNIFGQERIYPANKISDIFCDIAGRITLDRARLQLISKLGVEVIIKGGVEDEVIKAAG